MRPAQVVVTSIVQTILGRRVAIDAQAMNRLDEFYDLLKWMREILSILGELFGDANKGYKAKALRLRQLTGIRSVVSATA